MIGRMACALMMLVSVLPYGHAAMCDAGSHHRGDSRYAAASPHGDRPLAREPATCHGSAACEQVVVAVAAEGVVAPHASTAVFPGVRRFDTRSLQPRDPPIPPPPRA